jgi:hypothetical protein
MMHPKIGRQRAFSLTELCGALVAATLLLAILLPGLAGAGSKSMIAVSLGNLAEIGAAHALYAAEWNGRQVTVIRDDISTYGDRSAVAFPAYNAVNDPPHPGIILGWGRRPYGAPLSQRTLFEYPTSNNDANNGLVVPIRFGPPGDGVYFGSFRVPNARPLHDYVGGRFYDPTFYAPADAPVYDAVEDAGCFRSDDEYTDCMPPTPDIGEAPGWSSYCFSPAALFHPDVMRHPIDGGWQDPWSLDQGFETPGLFQARHPALKTLMLEHRWVQNTPKDVCNPAFDTSVYFGQCEPYYFNHAIASAPATLFYDLSTRLLPNAEALTADKRALKQTGDGLWSRDTPFGTSGYLSEYGFDPEPISHHVLTTEGILGRDTTAGGK